MVHGIEFSPLNIFGVGESKKKTLKGIKPMKGLNTEKSQLGKNFIENSMSVLSDKNAFTDMLDKISSQITKKANETLEGIDLSKAKLPEVKTQSKVGLDITTIVVVCLGLLFIFKK